MIHMIYQLTTSKKNLINYFNRVYFNLCTKHSISSDLKQCKRMGKIVWFSLKLCAIACERIFNILLRPLVPNFERLHYVNLLRLKIGEWALVVSSSMRQSRAVEGESRSKWRWADSFNSHPLVYTAMLFIL